MQNVQGKVTRQQATKVREVVAAHGVKRIGCSAFQMVGGSDAGRWYGMGCVLSSRVLGDCLFTTQPLSYSTRERAAQGALDLLARIVAGRADVIEEAGRDNEP
jgi:hypothetical protein